MLRPSWRQRRGLPKAPIAQRWLTTECKSRTHSHSSFFACVLLLFLFFFFFLLSFYWNPSSTSTIFLVYPHCQICHFLFFFISRTSLFSRLSPYQTCGWMYSQCGNTVSLWHRALERNKKTKSPPHSCCLSHLLEMYQLHQKAQQFEQEWCDFLLLSQLCKNRMSLLNLQGQKKRIPVYFLISMICKMYLRLP